MVVGTGRGVGGAVGKVEVAEGGGGPLGCTPAESVGGAPEGAGEEAMADVVAEVGLGGGERLAPGGGTGAEVQPMRATSTVAASRRSEPWSASIT